MNGEIWNGKPWLRTWYAILITTTTTSISITTYTVIITTTRYAPHASNSRVVSCQFPARERLLIGNYNMDAAPKRSWFKFTPERYYV